MNARRTPRALRVVAAAGVALAGGLTACADILDIPSDRYVAESTSGDGGPDGASADGQATCASPIKVKLLGDFTGPTRAFDDAAYAVIDYLREINATGGISGCKVEYEVRDFGYVAANALAVYDDWKSQPDWPDVALIFGWATPDGIALGPKLKEDKKPLITGSYLGAFATPDPVSRQVTIPEVNDSFEENTIVYNVQSDGFPYTYFVATDYSTSARISMLQAKLLGAKRVGFVRCSDEFCRATALAAQEYAKRQGLSIGRTLVRELSPVAPNGQPVPTGTEQSYEDGVYQYFKDEKAHAASEASAGRSYDPVDFLWVGNLAIHTAWVANGVQRVKDDPTLGYDVQILANKQGFDETLFAFPTSADRVHGVLPTPSYGDVRAPEMSRIMALHDKWREIDYQAALADAGASPSDGGAPTKKSYKSGRYVQGYVNALLFRLGVEKVLGEGKPVTGETLKAAFDTFQDVDTGGLTKSLRFTPTDHRPQSTETFYRVSGGQFVLEAERSIVLEDGWLGW